MDVLNKGLLFIPTKNLFHVDLFQNGLNRLTRSLKLKDFFSKLPPRIENKPIPFLAPSIFNPPKISDSTQNTITRLDRVTKEFLRGKPLDPHGNIKVPHPQNLTLHERESLKTLSQNDSIIIKPSDKGGSIVVMEKVLYIAECNRQLSDLNYYKEIPTPIFTTNIAKINNILRDLHTKKFLQTKQLNYLLAPLDCRPRIFYILPKIHKNKNTWPCPNMPPGRPIVSDCGSESYMVSNYIDSFLNPLSNKHPSYLKDTGDFLSKITNIPIPHNALLVTGDITSLYTNMDLNRTLAVVKRLFKENPDPARPDPHILNLLEITLKNNDFTFNSKTFLQTCGIAMGKKYAPSLANIYLIYFDLVLSKGFQGIVPLLPFRFLDDVFFLWTGSVELLIGFEKYLGNVIPGIKITFNHHPTFIDFLDTTVYKCTLQDFTVLHTRIFFKPTDTHQLLHVSSFHPPHTSRGVLKSQVIRYKRISSTYVDFETVCTILFRSLVNRGYSKRELRKMKSLIWSPYEKPPCAMFESLPVTTVKPCHSKKCLTCKSIVISSTYPSTVYNKLYPVLRNSNCQSSNLVYLITCSLCSKQYVGETGNTLRDRLNNHRSDIKTKKPTSIAIHFNLPNHSFHNLQIIPIEVLEPGTLPPARKVREAFWQKALGTIYPQGLNCFPIDPNTPLVYRNLNPPQKELIPITLPYCSFSAKLIKLWKSICEDDPTFKDCKFIAAFSNSKNLATKLVHSKL